MPILLDHPNKSFTQQHIQIDKSLVKRQKISSPETYRKLNTHPNKIKFKQFIVFRCVPLGTNKRSDLSNLLFRKQYKSIKRSSNKEWVGGHCVLFYCLEERRMTKSPQCEV